jgi:hypothetical protein
MFKSKKGLFLSLFASICIVSSIEAAVPNAPGSYLGVTKLDDSNTSVRISALDNSDNEKGFYLSVYDSSSALFDTIKIDASDKAYIYSNITGLTCDETYQAVLVAYNDDGNSSQSDLRAFNLKSSFGAKCPTESNVSLNAPGPYIGVTPLNGSKTAVRVNFLDNSNNEDGFKVFGDGIDVDIPANNGNPQVYADLTGLTCDKSYQIQAVAYKNGVNSQASDVRDFNIHTTFGISCDQNGSSPVPVCIDPTTLTPEFD